MTMPEGEEDRRVRPAGGGPRPRLVSAEVTEQEGAQTRIHVKLEYDGTEYMGQATGSRDDLNVCSEAAIAALENAIRRPGNFSLIGTTFVEFLDTTAVVVAIRVRGQGLPPLLGAVPAHEDEALCVAMSVLDATNRSVEAILVSDAP